MELSTKTIKNVFLKYYGYPLMLSDKYRSVLFIISGTDYPTIPDKIYKYQIYLLVLQNTVSAQLIYMAQLPTIPTFIS